MATTELAPPATTPAKAEDTKPNSPSVRAVVVSASAIAAVLAASAAFVLGGWIALAAAGGVTAAGAVGVAAVRNPSRRTRTRRPRKLPAALSRPSTGKMSWPLTGNQSKRAASKGSKGSAGGRSGKSGLGLPKLPAVTSKGRARKAATAARGASKKVGLPVAKSSRAVTAAKRMAKTAPSARKAARPGAKPTARKPASTRPGAAPRTPSRTPSRAGTRPRLTTGSKGTRRAPGSVLPKVSRPTSRKGALPKPGASRGRVTPKLGSTGKTAPKLGSSRGRVLPKLGRGGGTRGSGAGRIRRSVPKVGASKGRATKPGIKLPGLSGRSARRLGSTTTAPRKAIAGARRLGTTKRVPKRIQSRVPNRTVRRPVPARRGSVRRLLGTALGVPKHRGERRGLLGLASPGLQARRNARRVLVRHANIGARRLLKRAAASPYRSLRPWLRHLDRRARGLTAPGAIPYIDFPTTDPTPTIRRYRHPVPQLTGRRAVAATPKESTTMSNPTEIVIDAFNQMAQFRPQNEVEMSAFLESNAQMFIDTSTSLAGMADGWRDELPLAAPVIESLFELAGGLAKLADHATEAHHAYETAHESELARLRTPRPGEEFWDVSRNR